MPAHPDVQNELGRTGYFTATSFLGAQSSKAQVAGIDTRTKGSQFSTSPAKTGKGPDSFFDGTTPRLYEGEAYEDQKTREYSEQKSKKKLNLSGPFIPSSPSKRGSGIYGTISKPPEYIAPIVEKKLKKGDVKTGMSNFLGSATKTTGSGYPNGGIGKDYEYVPTPYERQHELEKKEKMQRKKLEISSQPFSPRTRGADFFDPTIHTLQGTTPRSRKKKEHHVPPITSEPFRPPNNPKQGLNSTFSKFPEYKTEPYLDPSKRLKKFTEQSIKSKPIGPGFFPVGSGKKGTSPSIVGRNVI